MAESQQAAALLVVGEDGSVNGTNGEALAAALNDRIDPHDTNENCAHENGQDDGPTIDIIINNVVASYSTRCHLDLRRIATDGKHVEYKREFGMCNMKIRRPYTTATIWSSGKITCTGATSEEASKIAARRFARQLQRLGFRVKFANFRVVNVLGTCILPFKIKITNFSRKHTEHASYEPELHPGVTYRIKEPKATLKIFSTGSITVTAPCVANVQSAIEHIFPLVLEFRADDQDIDKSLLENEARFINKQRGIVKPKRPVMNFDDCEGLDSDNGADSEESFDSDESQD
ncbi:TATA box-binding protein-like protein 1 [Mizuhopecten yessoensis]|uniref:TATA box-binding protein-like 1 n=1 Tax=Mizuhopecten yessoensis TaxID=6573 RepID=A0A210PHE2_MIZYE|nr:TATA box-binding protein-like protein 1 [Mizuhopecten yessoensis]OWF35909.1 TATA box-binding protein-like protein 1 [Mizuhopecten yessoensis]